MDEDAVIAARIRGLSVERIARSRKRGVTPEQIHDVIDRCADRVLTPDARRHALAIELLRLDRLMETAWPKAMGGDLAAIAIAEKLSARRCVMLGLHAPTTAILKIIDESAPRVTSTQELEATLDALTEDGPADGQVPN
jgi:hypothetical protein